MGDKLKQGIAVLTTFVTGETPTAEKLNSIAAQLRRATQLLECAVGDMRDESYPYSSATLGRLSPPYGLLNSTDGFSGMADRTLDIANLARLIGPASNLNPSVLPGSRSITEDVPASSTEFSTKFPVKSGTSISFSKNGSGEAFQTQVALTFALNGPYQYYIGTDGKIYTTTATDASDPGTMTYTIDPDEWFGGPNTMGSRMNVLPDPNQLNTPGGSGCTVGSPDAQGRRAVTVPAITHAQYNDAMTGVALGVVDPNYNQTPTLPLVLTNSWTVGEVIPAGFLVVKNWTTGEVYADATYYYNGTTSVLIGGVDITTEVDRGDDFVICTVGTDLTTSVDHLRRAQRHSHDRQFGEPLIDIDHISGFTKGAWSSQGSFTVSSEPSNFAPQYLHRYGFDMGDHDYNDNNVMRGDFVVGERERGTSTYLDPGNVVGDPAATTPNRESFKVAFGHPDLAYLYLDRGVSTLLMKNDISAGAINLVPGAGGYVLFGGSSTSYVETEANRALFSLTKSGVGTNDFPMYVQNNITSTGACGLLDLHFSAQSSNNSDYYVRFKDSVGTRGSIRGSDVTGDEAFYSDVQGGGGPAAGAEQEGASTGPLLAQTLGNVRFISGGADYGEWIEAGDLHEWDDYSEQIHACKSRFGLSEGLVVYVRGGRFYRRGKGTPMIITNRAVVVGNENESVDLIFAEVLSFIGQVPVYAIGPVNDGDLLVPSVDEPSAVVAVNPEDADLQTYMKAIGTAWYNKSGDGIGQVLCAVGKK